MTRIIPSILVASFIALPGLATAGSDSGFYIGGSIGSAQLDYKDEDPDFGNIDFDDSDTAYKIFAGYNIGIVPLIDLAVEGAYVNFGTQDGEINQLGGSSIEVDGWTGAGLVGVNLGPVGLFGKVGFISWDGDIKSSSLGSASDSGTDPLYGIGAKFQLFSFQIRAEYELYDLNNVDIDYFSVGAAYTF